MFKNMMIGMLCGFVVGAVWGLAVAMWSRDGIWPAVWAGAVLAFGIVGGIVGAFS